MMKEKGKVLIVIGSFKIGGAERMAITIGEELLSRGYDIHFAIQKPIYQIPNNIPKHRINVLNKKLDSNKYLHHINNIFQIYKLGRSLKPDVVIGFTYFSSFLSCFSFCKNIIATFDVNPYLLGKKRHRTADFVCRWPGVKRIIGPSMGTVSELKQARPQFRHKFITIYNSVDQEKVEKSANGIDVESRLKNKKFISAMGRLSEQKNFSLLISSYAQSQIKEHFNLAIVGDGPLRGELEKEIKDYNLEEKVFLLGFRANPYPYIKQSEFFVNTSYYESFCMVILEALSLGKMVIATDCDSGPAEMIKNNYNGFLIGNRNSKELINCFDMIAENPKVIIKKGSKAGESVTKFQISSIGLEWVNLIQALV